MVKKIKVLTEITDALRTDAWGLIISLLLMVTSMGLVAILVMHQQVHYTAATILTNYIIILDVALQAA